MSRRILLCAAVVAAGTWAGFPTLSAMVAGALAGALWPGRAARTAASGAAIAWAALLLGRLATGTDLGAASAKLGAAMGLPAWAPVVATLLYPAIIAPASAWLVQLVTSHRSSARSAIAPTS